MGLERRDRERLLDAWCTMWLLRASPRQGDLLDMPHSMRGRLERIQRLPPVAGVGEENEAADDTAELVLVLERLTGESSRRP